MSAYRKHFSIFVPMGFKSLKHKKWFKIISNKYVLILLIFVIWMFWFDGNSWLIHHELDQDIEKLKGNQAHFESKIKEDQTQNKKLEDSAGIERFAREEYLMKKEDEDIYIIEYEDSLQKK